MPSVIEASLNFTNSILGAGLMGIPYAFKQAGLIPGCLILILVAIVSGHLHFPGIINLVLIMLLDWSVGLMIKCGRRVRAGSYQELMWRVFGRPGGIFCAFMQIIFSLGCRPIVIIMLRILCTM